MDTVEQQQAVRKYRFYVEEYHRIGEAGIFHEDDRVDLIDGEVMRMSPVGWLHIYCVRRLNRVLSEWTLRNSDGEVPVFVSVQDPFALNERGEPQPDLAILREPPSAVCPDPTKCCSSWRSPAPRSSTIAIPSFPATPRLVYPKRGW